MTKKKLPNSPTGGLMGFSHTQTIAFIMTLFAVGGYGGWEVHRQYAHYGANFEGRTHMVTQVPDGDTVRFADGTTVRILGLDAPELDQCYGPESRNALRALVLGREVRILKDVNASDNYNRLLRYLFVLSDHPKENNVHVSEHMIKQGFARYYPSPQDKLYHSLFLNAQGEARNANRGLHGACEIVTDIVPQPSDSCNIKANVADGTKKKTYFYPGCPNYKTVKVERSKGETYFCSPQEAEQAGYVPAWRCPTNP